MHCKGVVKRDTLTKGGKQELLFIPEGDVIRLVARSKLPAAERFESWVFYEVIPSVLRTGTYTTPQAAAKPRNPDYTGLPAEVASIFNFVNMADKG